MLFFIEGILRLFHAVLCHFCDFSAQLRSNATENPRHFSLAKVDLAYGLAFNVCSQLHSCMLWSMMGSEQFLPQFCMELSRKTSSASPLWKLFRNNFVLKAPHMERTKLKFFTNKNDNIFEVIQGTPLVE
ncbi:hypothetical protein Y032_0110g155 [Ancylostoma ceylanicum]|uniref:Secreted protein n=1 Tax=Ancylostoma ceylanicum TaxID=53326 RepID=A0A016TEM3_9BILA|nr:hypothetical protein Y032_0110g155 [Ancylostoma ceylanicum]